MQNLRRLDPEPLHARTHALRAWVLTAAAFLAQAFEDTLSRAKFSRHWRIFVRAALRRVAGDLKMLIVALALAHLDEPVPRPRTTRPRSRRRGFRHARNTGSVVRRAKRRVRLAGGSICARIARMCAILADLKRWIARMIVHLERRSPTARLVAVAPPAQIFAGRARPARICADTS